MELFLPDLDHLPPPDPCSLIKLGGSLLTSPGLRERLPANLRRLSANPILLVGGGGLADIVRQWDAVHGLSTVDSDTLATMTLSISAEFVQSLVPGAAIVNSYDDAAQILRAGGIPIVDVHSTLTAPSVEALPQGWHVTSDSMAAVIARAWGLRELVLVKSTSCPAGRTIEQVVAEGLVDAYFPNAVRGGLPIQWCDGRRDVWQAETWLGVDAA